jgi:hypothetical protein
MQIQAPRVSKPLEPVKFRDDTIFAIEYDAEPFTPVRPIVENMELDWSTQYRKLINNRDRWSVVMMTTVAADGKSREQYCLPVRKLPGLLATINPNKVKPGLRPKIIAYQNECDDVLWRYWSGKHPVVPANVAPDPKRLEGKLLRMVRCEIAKAIPEELEKYARLAAEEEHRQENVRKRLRSLLSEATGPGGNSQQLAAIESKLDLLLVALREG